MNWITLTTFWKDLFKINFMIKVYDCQIWWNWYVKFRYLCCNKLYCIHAYRTTRLWIITLVCHTMHTVSFDWFLSGLGWILNFEFSLQNLLIFYWKKKYGISDLDINLPHFEFFSLYLHMFDQNLFFFAKRLQFWSNISKYRLKNSTCGKVEPWSDIP